MKFIQADEVLAFVWSGPLSRAIPARPVSALPAGRDGTDAEPSDL